MMSIKGKESGNPRKKEEGISISNNVIATIPSSSSSNSRQWSSLGFKNPRIVRVSRTFGGKDRHSKVCTIKGLRDRRIRLSVPTAIQLYDLQDRLGLNQPSKVIDWLLDSTKHDIDKLPPLPILPGSFNSFSSSSSSSSTFFNSNFLPFSRRESININEEKLKYWEEIAVTKTTNQKETNPSAQVFAQNFFPISTENNNNNILHPNPNSMLNNYYYKNWDPSSNLSLAQLGTLGGFSSQNGNECQQNNSNPKLPPSSSLSSSSRSQLFLPPSMETTAPLFPTQTYSLINMNSIHQVENLDLRQFNRFDSSISLSSSLHSSSSLGPRTFPLSMIHENRPHLHQNEENHRDKDD